MNDQTLNAAELPLFINRRTNEYTITTKSYRRHQSR